MTQIMTAEEFSWQWPKSQLVLTRRGTMNGIDIDFSRGLVDIYADYGLRRAVSEV